MKMLNVLELLCESKVDFVKKRYAAKIVAAYKKTQMGMSFFDDDDEIPEKVINGIVRFVDPSMKYLEWIVKQYIAGLYREEEDDEQVKEDLEEFEKHKRKMQHQDINRYNLNTLREELAKFAEHEDGGDFHQQIQDAIKKGDVDYIGKQNGIDIYHTLTKEGNILLGRGGGHDNLNKWCTSRPDDKNRFDYYNKDNNIYVWIFEDGRRFQCDVERTSSTVQNWMNERDIDIVLEKIDSSYWEKMRTTQFMIDIRDKALNIEFKLDEYNTTIKDFTKLCNIYDKRFMNLAGSVIHRLPLDDFEIMLPEILTNMLSTSHIIHFLYDLDKFTLAVDKNSNLIKYHYGNNHLLDNRFSDRVHDIVNDSKGTKFENLVQLIINDNATIGNLSDRANRQKVASRSNSR